ncbi:hypothetical protein [Mesobacterium pallidum]|uniref:hypothetical protein n=1 Tax=Mesobacterium pallidum TaxID=2872037 RepID=UPI001EE1D785|nr:hypothetical protein [Mesobacterium pallidum]
MTEPYTLADALPDQIKRVTEKKERWQQMMREHDMGPGMQLTINIMQAEIERGVKALASGDVAEMLAAHQSLADYNDDD